MKIKDEAEFYDWYAAQESEYGQGIFHYAVLWADLMEYLMDNGYELDEIAAMASFEAAEIISITGYMYGCAVSTLAHCWEHGEELRQWHNIDSQIGNEGERANEEGTVLNPALINVR